MPPTRRKKLEEKSQSIVAVEENKAPSEPFPDSSVDVGSKGLFFCPVVDCSKHSISEGFKGWKAPQSMISCVLQHCLHGGIESVPESFWNDRFL